MCLDIPTCVSSLGELLCHGNLHLTIHRSSSYALRPMPYALCLCLMPYAVCLIYREILWHGNLAVTIRGSNCTTALSYRVLSLLALLLQKYKATDTSGAACHILSLLALLLQKFKKKSTNSDTSGAACQTVRARFI